jgi:RNA polymerase sigma-70 factor (ECF subfamily)
MSSAFHAHSIDECDPLPPAHDWSGHEAALLEGLYRRERPGLLRFLSRHASFDRAEDVVQSLFSRMAARAPGAQAEIEAPTAYLRHAARNMLVDEVRGDERSGRQRHVPIEDAILPAVDPVASLEARDRLRRIEEAVWRLKPLTREIFLACRLDGYSYAQIAERTGLSVKGVEKQMSRAIKQLGRHLRAHE